MGTRRARTTRVGARSPTSRSLPPRTSAPAARWTRSRTALTSRRRSSRRTSPCRPPSAEAAHETLLKDLQAKYKDSMDALEKLKEDSAPKIKLLKAATPKADAPAKEAAKDEM